jgi:hypothetical protein
MVTALAACGGGSTKAVAPVTTTTVAGRGARQAAFSQCMQSHGVKLPAGSGVGFGGRPGTGGAGDTTGSTRSVPTTTIPPGVTTQQWQSALAACNSQLPNRGNAQNNPQFQLYYNCLQTYLMTHGGTTLPPLSQGGAGIFGGGGGGSTATTTNPTLQAARDHCVALRPTGGVGSTTTTAKP